MCFLVLITMHASKLQFWKIPRPRRSFKDFGNSRIFSFGGNRSQVRQDVDLIPHGDDRYIDFHYIPTGWSCFASIKRLNKLSDRFQVPSFRRRSIDGAANRSFPYAILRVLLPSIRQRHSVRLYYTVMFSSKLNEMHA